MPIRARLMGSHLHAIAAANITGSNDIAVTATGTTITDAYKIIHANTYVTTTASGTGVVLPAIAEPSDCYFVANNGANTLLVYPGSSSGTISRGSAGAGFSVASGKSAYFVCSATDNVSYSA